MGSVVTGAAAVAVGWLGAALFGAAVVAGPSRAGQAMGWVGLVLLLAAALVGAAVMVGEAG